MFLWKWVEFFYWIWVYIIDVFIESKILYGKWLLGVEDKVRSIISSPSPSSYILKQKIIFFIHN